MSTIFAIGSIFILIVVILAIILTAGISNKKTIRYVKNISFEPDIETTTIAVRDANNKESCYKVKAGTEIKFNVNVGEVTMTFIDTNSQD